SVTAEGFGYDPARGELWFAGETAEAVMLELEARRRALAQEAVELERRARETTIAAAEAARRAQAAEAAYGRVTPVPLRPAVARETLDRLLVAGQGLMTTIGASRTIAERFEAPLRARVDAGAHRAGELGDELRRLGAAEVEVRRELEDASERATAVEVDLARLEAEAKEAHGRLESADAVAAAKRITRLSLLSGGEKALGAISFLFALFLARPCAFYLLDEVEAALDDTNIARFVELLRRYSDRAQFVVITHQKRTMEAADVLYG